MCKRTKLTGHRQLLRLRERPNRSHTFNMRKALGAECDVSNTTLEVQLKSAEHSEKRN